MAASTGRSAHVGAGCACACERGPAVPRSSAAALFPRPAAALAPTPAAQPRSTCSPSRTVMCDAAASPPSSTPLPRTTSPTLTPLAAVPARFSSTASCRGTMFTRPPSPRTLPSPISHSRLSPLPPLSTTLDSPAPPVPAVIADNCAAATATRLRSPPNRQG
ncbi:unnamed protein product [Closterium sp. NIES-54]